MQKISDHITYNEATYSDTAKRFGIDNNPTFEQLVNMVVTAGKLFEPVRTHFDVPIHVASFFRSEVLNIVIGGSTTSDHMTGESMDIDADKYNKIRNKHIFDYVKDNLDFDQLIAENVSEDKWTDVGWIHFSYKKERNRKQVLLSEWLNGKRVYYPYDSVKGLDIKLYR
jgi:zinc D-Ala-D-Ala carboxypeptidase